MLIIHLLCLFPRCPSLYISVLRASISLVLLSPEGSFLTMPATYCLSWNICIKEEADRRGHWGFLEHTGGGLALSLRLQAICATALCVSCCYAHSRRVDRQTQPSRIGGGGQHCVDSVLSCMCSLPLEFFSLVCNVKAAAATSPHWSLAAALRHLEISKVESEQCWRVDHRWAMPARRDLQ